MTQPADHVALEGAIAEIRAVAAEFARAARPAVEEALRRRLEALLDARRSWFEALGPDIAGAFRTATDRAIAGGGAEVERRLADLDLWLDPLTAPGLAPRPESGWNSELPEWLIGILRRFATTRSGPALGELDDPGNRVWVAMLSAAKPLDPVIEEFGLPPSEIPDLGGGNYGLAPQSAAQLDPTGRLAGLWKGYRAAYERYAALARRPR